MREVDVLVVGAGPAGASAARGLAAAGVRVLLVDAAEFPRWKVCGCCLNGAALQVLDDLGLADLPKRLGANRLTQLQVSTRSHNARLTLPVGSAVSRVRLDAALLHAAVDEGAHAQTGTTAEWIEEQPGGVAVALHAKHEVTKARARVVIAADGLAAGFTRHVPGIRSKHVRHARIGAGTTIDHHAAGYGRHIIHMAIGVNGYVGLVRIENDQLNIAAALDPEFVRKMRGLPNAAARVIAEAGLPEIDALRSARWQGTPPLTRTFRPPPLGRLFLIGDAAEYVEPFTGEGMAWALAAGAGVVDHIIDALNGGGIAAQAAWLRRSQEMLGERKRRCRLIAKLLRHPRLTNLSVHILSMCPGLATSYLRSLNSPRFDCDLSRAAPVQS